MFSDSLNELTNEQLKNTNYGRILLLNKFEELISNHKLPKEIKIGIVGGSKNEPEVLLLEKLGYEMSLTTFGIEAEDDIFLDLNESNNQIEEYNFDIILCGQVLEHIWNVNNFVLNILLISNKETLVYVHCPKSNIHHGHTYFSSGYSKEFLVKIFDKENIIIHEFGELGTARLYTSIHLLKDWITTREAIKGKVTFRTWNSFLWNLNNTKPLGSNKIKYFKFLFSYRKLLINFILKILSNNENEDKLVKSETYILFQNNN